MIFLKIGFAVHKAKMKQRKHIRQLKHLVFLRLAKRTIRADKLTLFEFVEYGGEIAVVGDFCVFYKVRAGHTFAYGVKGADDGDVVV